MNQKQLVIDKIEYVMSQNHDDKWLTAHLFDFLQDVKEETVIVSLQEFNDYLFETFGMT